MGFALFTLLCCFIVAKSMRHWQTTVWCYALFDYNFLSEVSVVGFYFEEVNAGGEV